MENPGLLHELHKTEESVSVQDPGHRTNLGRQMVIPVNNRSVAIGIDEITRFGAIYMFLPIMVDYDCSRSDFQHLRCPVVIESGCDILGLNCFIFYRIFLLIDG